MEMSLDDFGILRALVENDDITDINWNGNLLLVNNVKKGKDFIDFKLSNDFVEKFTRQIANLVKKNFNQYDGVLEAEVDSLGLRIECVHASNSNTGTVISIRKSFKFSRIKTQEALESGFIDENGYRFLKNAVENYKNIMICGEPGAGKTETIKWLTNFINPLDFVTTIEDVLELHYPELHPKRYCVELKVSDRLSYGKAIQTSLRLMTKWLLLAEARGKEASHLLDAMGTGTHNISTIHAQSAVDIPYRLKEMIAHEDGTDKEKMDRIFQRVQVGVHIVADDTGSEITRKISQIVLFDYDYGKNKTYVLFDKGTWNLKVPEKYKMLVEQVR